MKLGNAQSNRQDDKNRRFFRVGLAGVAGLMMAGLLASASVHDSSALTYQKGVNVQFTFGSTLNVTLSSANLIIPNLAPGTYNDSNIITVNVDTNATYGYTLSAAAGDGTTYTNTDLVNSNDSNTTTKKFTSLSTSDSYASMSSASDNYWGYSFSADNGTNWANYSGLPYCTPVDSECTQGTALITTTNAAESNSVKFKIGAKASNDKPAGTYRNVIVFYATAAPEPITFATAYENAGKTQLNGYYKLQDMTTSICSAVEVYDENSQTQVIDTRDNKVYWIAKLQDDHCWMTQNLDLDLGVNTLTHNSTTLYHDDTDLGWGSDSATTSWIPDNATINVTYDSNMYGTFASIGQSTTDYNVPKSLNVGDWYYAGYDGTTLLASTTVNYLTSNNRTNINGVVTVNNGSGVDYFSTAPFAINGEHGHVGNYYNWSAAVASNDTSSYTTSTYSDITGNPQNSICPAGWRLPTITSATPSYSQANSRNEFARLSYLYANYVGSSGISSASLENLPISFVRGGSISDGQLKNSGDYGRYWSSTAGYMISYSAYNYSFTATTVRPENEYNGAFYIGYSVRCLAR